MTDRVVSSGGDIATALAASAPGDRVLLERGGTWTTSNTLLTVPAGVTVMPTGTYAEDSSSNNNPLLTGYRFQLQAGAKLTKGPNDPHNIRAALAGNMGGTGISLRGVTAAPYVSIVADGTTCEYLDIRGLWGTATNRGILWTDQSDTTVYKCFIDGEDGATGGDCVAGGTFSKDGTVGNNNRVSWCVLRNPGSAYGDGVHIDRQTNCYIGYNDIGGSLTSGKGHIILHPYGAKTGLETGLNIIEHNTLEGVGFGYAIECYHTHTEVRFNRCVNLGGPTLWGGLWFYGDPTEFTDDQVDIYIHDNIIDGFKFGFVWSHDSNSWTTKLIDLLLEHNTFVNCNTAGNSAWFFSDVGAGELVGTATGNLAFNNGNSDAPYEMTPQATITDNYNGTTSGDPLLDAETYVPANPAAEAYGVRFNLGTPGVPDTDPDDDDEEPPVEEEPIIPASGILFPSSAYPATSGQVFPNIYLGNGDEGLGVRASLSVDATWRLRFQLPPVLPDGSPVLRLLALATTTSGEAKVNPKWASVAVGENPSTATLAAEGTQTLTWGGSDSGVYKQIRVPLDANTLVAGEIVAMDLVFETSGWTLTVVSTWIPAILWE